MDIGTKLYQNFGHRHISIFRHNLETKIIFYPKFIVYCNIFKDMNKRLMGCLVIGVTSTLKAQIVVVMLTIKE